MRVWASFIALSLAWGSSYLWIRIGVREVTPLELVTMRLLVASAGIGGIIAVRRHRIAITRTQLIVMAIIATTNITVPFLMITWAETQIPSGLTSVLNSTVPIFSVLIAGFALRDEPITLQRLGGVLLGFIGILLLLSRDLATSGIQWTGVTAQIAVVGASLLYAISAVIARRWLRGVPPMTPSAVTLFVAATQCTLLVLLTRPPLPHRMEASALIAGVWLGLIGSAFAYLFFYYILEHWGAARTTLVTYILPIVGLTLGAVFLHEHLDWRIVAGSLLVIAGIVLASLMPRRQTSREREAAASP